MAGVGGAGIDNRDIAVTDDVGACARIGEGARVGRDDPSYALRNALCAGLGAGRRDWADFRARLPSPIMGKELDQDKVELRL